MALLDSLNHYHVAVPLLAIPVAYLVYVAVYRLFFHPLAQYPGPFLAKLTTWYSAYHNYINDVHIDILRCHAEYGDFVRYGPDRLLVNSANGYHDIYGHGKNIAKSKAYWALLTRARQFSVLTAWDKKVHGRKRRVVGQGFTEAAVRGYEPVIKDNVTILCNKLLANDGRNAVPEAANAWSLPVDMSEFTNYLSFDIMTDVIFSVKRHLIENSHYRWITTCIERMMHRIGVLSMVPWTRWWGLGLHWLIMPDGVRASAQFTDEAKYFATARMKQQLPKGKKDVFQNLLNAKDAETGEGLPLPELLAEAGLLIVAGSDTTSSALAGIFFYLSRNPSVYARVAQEIRTTFPSVAGISHGPELRSCIYLHAVVDECLRMCPPVSAAPWRVVLKGGQNIDGHEIPEGIEVGTCLYSLMHNPAYFAEPFKFDPDRWIETESNPAATIELQRRAFVPFLSGARMCAAKNLAMAELLITTAQVLYTMDFKPADGPEGKLGEGMMGMGAGRERPEEFQLYSHFVTVAKRGPVLQFRRRETE
ncbi:uncharacterized protein Z520_03372 [Fonsecaea multimorphosa CBS 102226]|uniref:Benzoate 4-monooxygenase cytochrome P450 n=1 Tax=Fonsecaea multimorphosa CBS 102226 TaxID=1442371 RepID=A0A0D2IUH3_9EURO|nr:uncharacterized protein Z520_03372 [Fonsecaea multimorphosa CBS 102226]KIY00707.1 hypothetical protein Z520_03372 [Fonsecaea multimorphosa CBS 102226]OAL27753.1 hypothetical protein AYO22_03295 [Fonsecaea multimorphosa]